MHDALHLRSIVDHASPILLELAPEAAERRDTPQSWSAKEIIGHLIDSAAHNHIRFVEARWQKDLVFAGYDQNAWIDAQEYQEAPWTELVVLWQTYNHHLARVIAAVPEAIRMREHRVHNLHEVAWQPVPATAPATLDYFMRDYVGHLAHHLRQVGAVGGRHLVPLTGNDT